MVSFRVVKVNFEILENKPCFQESVDVGVCVENDAAAS
jgi:hypothetical protein